ncbi:MAG TPA: hypothetical protein DDW94_10940 [Deltaproteobacteria bacterium]|nr:MAG: hypothetical protein A2Z79_11440 [Deltaproteobacteria bacterium GWA2_55_82]OGQ63484.1 MAG: hypothetical protein A3I81_05625 [Deltaproteobacteria bacterium RIFCSPLOWO2_02_FULL_55_12]OIJ74865.1 MAG: hypothetical protein A2V21_311680 [Deltaproteobacteria bacterium GWC2_55_46]HBG47485.1 hypothetical protein [Deltaproteobacteria bacterium]HCY11501.1 hypothetical protein [Deltaproteobacteria bacterium]
MTLRIEIYEAPEAFLALRERWRGIAEGEGQLFSGPEWHWAWWKAFGGRALFYAGFDGGRLVGVWPFCLRRASFKDFYGRIAETLSGRSADYGLPAIEKGFEATFVRSVIEDLMEKAGRRTLIEFPHLPLGHPSTSALASYIRESGMRTVESETVCPVLEFGADSASTERSWKRTHRADLRRQRRRLEEIGTLRLNIPGGKEEAVELLPSFFSMHTAEWRARRFNLKFLDHRMRDFCGNLVDGLYGKGLHFSFLSCGAEVISMHLGFLSHGWLLWYMPAYDTAFEKYSPGKVHLHMLTELGQRQGWKGIDFLQGDEAYKLQWSNGRVETSSFTCSRAWSIQYSWLIWAKPWLIDNFGEIYRRLKSAGVS